ncbi:MAG: substrate-binding domain-containing protein [Acidimicrobiales bacterium]
MTNRNSSKRWRGIVALFLVFAMFAAACGDDDDDSGAADGADEPSDGAGDGDGADEPSDGADDGNGAGDGDGTDEPSDDLTIAFVTHVIGNPFIQQIIDGAEAAASDLGVNLEVTGPAGGDADAQLVAAQNLVAAGADGLAMSVPGSSIAFGVNEIIDGGTPVVTFNLLDTSVEAPYVGERSVESGRILGGLVLEELGGAEATGTAIIGNCFPGFPVLENRAAGVEEALRAAPGLEVLGPFDVKVEVTENYAAWEALLAANPDAKALVGLCAPDVASLGQLKAANPDSEFIGAGYDLTAENLAEIEAGRAFASVGQTPFMQGYLPVFMLVDNLRNGTPLEQGFVDAGTQVLTIDGSIEPYGLPSLSFSEVQELAGSPEQTREFYQTLVDNVIPTWSDLIEPIENEAQ